MSNAPCPLRAIEPVTRVRAAGIDDSVGGICALFPRSGGFFPERAIALWGITGKFTYTNWKNGEPAKLALSFDLAKTLRA
jgi:hypothetical protein